MKAVAVTLLALGTTLPAGAETYSVTPPVV